MQWVDAILDLLEDGKWHNLTELECKSGLRKFNLGVIIDFLAEYDLMRLEKDKQRVKLAMAVVHFLAKIRDIE